MNSWKRRTRARHQRDRNIARSGFMAHSDSSNLKLDKKELKYRLSKMVPNRHSRIPYVAGYLIPKWLVGHTPSGIYKELQKGYNAFRYGGTQSGRS